MRWRLPREAYRARCTRSNDTVTLLQPTESLPSCGCALESGSSARMTSIALLGSTKGGGVAGHDVQPAMATRPRGSERTCDLLRAKPDDYLIEV